MRREPLPHRDEDEEGSPKRVFRGYAQPTSNTTYTPNQFFDVVLPNASRGCLRLVAYLIRKTLGWSDEHGNPVNPQAHISYRELIENAGISRGAIKDAIDEAVSKRYVDCLRFGQPHRTGAEGYSALYSLRWDEREEYVTDPDLFDGFFAGNGNLTHIPNDFFDHTIPNEPLAVVKVVGAIIRNTIGFQTRYGFRRQHIEMSFVEIMRRTRIASSSTVSSALKAAIEGCHVRKVAEGVFDPNAGALNKATTFSIRWSDEAQEPAVETDGSKIEAANRFKNRSGDLGTVQKSKRDNGPKIEAANGSGIEAVTVQKSKRDEFKNRSDIETTSLNNTPKQHQTGSVVGAGDSLALLANALIVEGVGPDKAKELVERFPAELIRRQILWIPQRRVRRNRAGLLITAIEKDLPPPSVQTSEQDTPAAVFAAYASAEMAGNKGVPASRPTEEEEGAAESLLARVAGTPEEAGRRFGRFVSERERNKKNPVRTFGLAARLYGDEFLATESRSVPRAVEVPAKQELHTEFQAYLRGEAERLLGIDPDLGIAFERHLEEKLARRKKLSPRAYEITLQDMSDPERRAELLAEYIAEVRPGALLGFDAWQARTAEGPQSFEGGVGG